MKGRKERGRAWEEVFVKSLESVSNDARTVTESQEGSHVFWGGGGD